MGLITQLTAVNHMLINAGESPVADLSGASGVDTGVALYYLEEVSLDFQMRGLVNNRNKLTLVPDEDNFIFLPTADADDYGATDVKLLSRHYSSEQNEPIVLRVNNGTTQPQLFNVTDDTYEFTDDEYVVKVTKYLKWENLDTVTQRAIMAQAARLYQMFLQGDDEADNFLKDRADYYRAQMMSEDTHDRNESIFDGYQHQIRIFNNLARRRQYRPYN